MSLNTGGQTQTTAPGNLDAQNLALQQIMGGFNSSGGIQQFAQPSNLFNLSPLENLYRTAIMGGSLPGSMARQAAGYTAPGGMFGNLFQLSPDAQQAQQAGVQGMKTLTDPTGGLFKNYLNQMVLPSIQNNSIASGYGGASGATQENMQRGGTQAAMQYGPAYPGMVNSAIQLGQLPQSMQLQGLTSLGLPLAMQDYANLGIGEQAAGQQRMSSIQDMTRVQNIIQSMLGQLPTSTQGFTSTTQGPGTSASLLNFGAGALGNLFNGGLFGSGGSLGAQGITSLLKSFSGGGGGGTDPSTGQPGSGFSDYLSGYVPGGGNGTVPESTNPTDYPIDWGQNQ